MNGLKLIMALTLATLLAASASAAEDYRPRANDSQTVVAGNARFTVLTPRMIRMEWSADGRFEDNATFGIVNRAFDDVSFRSSVTSSKVTIRTDALTLTWRRGGRFSADNLSVEFAMNGRKVVWRPGMEDKGNLQGTMRTLDRTDGWNLHETFDPGVVSRDGWVILDESTRPIIADDDTRWGGWVAERGEGDRIDWYIMAYGHDYTAAVTDYMRVGGRQPLPPKYAFGYWWSRYWQYSDDERVRLVEQIQSLSIPIDVLIVDMEWHDTWGLSSIDTKRDEYGQRIGWTGYTWKRELFPSPENFIRWAHGRNLKVSLNLHPASGIQPYEAAYDDFAEDYGWQKAGEPIPFRICQQQWADSYFKTVLHPLQRQGVDFWWLDWQQWKQSKYMPSVSNTFWLNHTFFRDSELSSDERPMIYHRWGGLGSHRYQTAFSGDVFATWESLSFLPYFTSTASNVCYGYWGHDIGGHMLPAGVETTDEELFTRWLQYSVFTPIFKTHSTKDRNIERRLWAFGENMFTLRDAVRLRYTLSPYIYTAARQAYDTGISMCRPMYYACPEDERAYSYKEQHMFGDDMIVAAVARPADTVTGLAERSIWLPEGEWYDMATGTMYDGGEYCMQYTVDEIPMFVRAGAVIPMAADDISDLQHIDDRLVLTVIPGDGESVCTLYEDDGRSKDYAERYAVTTLRKHSTPERTTLVVEPRRGAYDGMPATRRYEIRLLGVCPPSSVTVDGREYSYDRFAETGGWTYDGRETAVRIFVDAAPCDRELRVECSFDTDRNRRELLDGCRGMIKRFARLTDEFKVVYNRYDRLAMLPEAYLKVSQLGSFITENPAEITRHIDQCRQAMPEMLREIESLDLDPGFKRRIEAQTRMFVE